MTEQSNSTGIMISNGVDGKVISDIGDLVLNILNTRNDQETIREALKVVGASVTPSTAPVSISNSTITMVNGEGAKPKSRKR